MMTETSYHELANAIRSVLESNETRLMFRQILLSVQSLIHCEAASIFLMNTNHDQLTLTDSTNLILDPTKPIVIPVGTGIAGWVAANNQSINIANVESDPRFFSGVDKKTGFKTHGYLCVPLRTSDETIGTIQALNRIDGELFHESEQELLECFAALAALAIRKSQMHETELAEQQLVSELSIASEFQKRLMPSEIPQPNGMQVTGHCSVARNIGGDYFDAFPTRNGYFAIVADVSGKGPGAGLWMSGLANLLRYLNSIGESILDAIPRIGAHFAMQFPLGTYITLFAAEVTADRFDYISAGHIPVILLTAEGEITQIKSTGVPLGLLPELPAQRKSLPFERGSRLILFTDGITEAENCNENMFGMSRLVDLVAANNYSSIIIKQKILEAIAAFSEGAIQTDDITLLIVERTV